MNRQIVSNIKWTCLLLLLFAILLMPQNIKAQASKVSPQLDFNVAENKNSTDVPIVLGNGQGGSVDDKQHRNGPETRSSGRDSDTSMNTGSSSSSSGKSGPKIHGVRVTVDTGDTQKSKENTESIEITDAGKHKKRVGIHTDITFEISTDGGSDGNITSSMQEDDKEDASVPIYKGRSDLTQKRRKPNDTKNHWSPNVSSERRSYENRGHGAGPVYYYPQFYPNNVPGYASNNDERGGSSGTNHRRGDGWNSYIPSSNVWTTERTYNELYRSNTANEHRSPSWKPCYCMTAVVDNRRGRANHHVTITHHVQPASLVVKPIDGKLDTPFLN